MKRHAFLIASNGAKDNPRRLLHAEHDIERVRQLLLRDVRGWQAENIHTIEQIRGTKHPDPQTIEEYLDLEIARIPEGDFILVYVVGHGKFLRGRGQHTQLFLELYDSKISVGIGKKPDWHTYLDLVRVSETFLKNKHHLMIALDCCSAGAVNTQKSFNDRFIEQVKSLFEPRNLDRLTKDRSAVILTACAESAEAFESSEGGYFTSHFLQGCDGGVGREAVGEEGNVSPATLYRYLRKYMQAEIGQQIGPPLIFGQMTIKSTYAWQEEKKVRNPNYPQPIMLLDEIFEDDITNVLNGRPAKQQQAIPHMLELPIMGFDTLYREQQNVLLIALADQEKLLIVTVERDVTEFKAELLEGNFGVQMDSLQLTPRYDGGAEITFITYATKSLCFLDHTLSHPHDVQGRFQQYIRIPHSERVVTYDDQNLLRHWQHHDGILVEIGEGLKLTESIICMSAVSHAVIIGSNDGKVLFISLESDRLMLIPLPLPNRRLSEVHVIDTYIRERQSLIVAGYSNGDVIIWKKSTTAQYFVETTLRRKNARSSQSTLHQTRVTSLEIAENGRWLATGGSDGNCYVFDNLLDDAEPASELDVVTHLQSRKASDEIVITKVTFHDLTKHLPKPILVIVANDLINKNGYLLIWNLALNSVSVTPIEGMIGGVLLSRESTEYSSLTLVTNQWVEIWNV